MMRRMVCFLASGMLLASASCAEAASQNGTEVPPAASAAPSANATQASPQAPAEISAETTEQQSIAPEAAQALAYLKAADYANPEKSIRRGGSNRVFQAFETLVRNGRLQEADEQIARLAAAPLDEKDKRLVGDEIFKARIELFERLGPLVQGGFFVMYMGDEGWLPQYLAYEYIRYFNKQKTAQDKLRAARFYRMSLAAYVKEHTRVTDKRELASLGYILCVFSRDDISDYAAIGPVGPPPTIAFTPPPQPLPQFSDKAAADTGKAGKYLIVRTLKDGPKDADYFVDFAMMAALPPAYLPENFEQATRIVTVDSRWVKGGKFINGPDAYLPVSVTKVFDAGSGRLVATIGEHKQHVPQTAIIKKGAEKYFSEVDKVAVCTKIVDWLEKGKKK